jgi:hypothetical protein
VEHLSQHPVDLLIRELIQSGRPASDEEVAQIIERIATAPFNPSVVTVAMKHRGLSYRGLTLGRRAASLTYHLVQRVVADGQWSVGTTENEYLSDIRRAVGTPQARLAVYARRGGTIAATLTATRATVRAQQLGTDWLPELLVVYSADQGYLVSGYQVSGLATTGIPEEALWLA